jgi:hypothetical protein
VKFSKSFFRLALVLLAIPFVAQASSTDKTPPCSLATLNGTYGGFSEGSLLFQIPGLPPPPLPFAAVGLPTYDGAGNVSTTSATSFGGFIVPWGMTSTGTYKVTRDCSFSAVQTAADGTVITWAGTITGRGTFQEIHLIYTDPYWVISGTQRKTPPGGCSQGTLQGTYAIFGHGFFTLPDLPPLLPGAHAGMLTADGLGNVSGEETFNHAGIAGSDTYTATYTVNPDCTFSATVTFADQSVLHEVGTVSGVGRFQEVHSIATDSGIVFADTIKKP